MTPSSPFIFLPPQFSTVPGTRMRPVMPMCRYRYFFFLFFVVVVTEYQADLLALAQDLGAAVVGGNLPAFFGSQLDAIGIVRADGFNLGDEQRDHL